MNKILVSLLLLAVISPLNINIYADANDPKVSVDAKKVQKQENIRKIFELTLDKDILLATMKSGFEQLNAQFGVKNHKQYSKIKELANTLFEKFAQEMLAPETIKQIAHAYDTIYTADEIEQLLHFYSSPVGRKTIKKAPELMATVSAVIGNLTQKYMGDYINAVNRMQQK